MTGRPIRKLDIEYGSVIGQREELFGLVDHPKIKAKRILERLVIQTSSSFVKI